MQYKVILLMDYYVAFLDSFNKISEKMKLWNENESAIE